MGIVVTLRDDQLESAVENLKRDGFVFKCMYDSSDSDLYHEEDLEMTKIYDADIFSQSIDSYLKHFRMKSSDEEIRRLASRLVNDIKLNEREYVLVNDHCDYPLLALVFTTQYINRTSAKDSSVLVSPNSMDIIMETLGDELFSTDGMKCISYNSYMSLGIPMNHEKTYDAFLVRQNAKVDEMVEKDKVKVFEQFLSSYKYRVMTYYSQLIKYTADEIVDQLLNMGYLDPDVFTNVICDKEKAARILAKRLSSISFKNDIEFLIRKGIMSKDKILYDIGLDFDSIEVES